MKAFSAAFVFVVLFMTASGLAASSADQPSMWDWNWRVLPPDQFGVIRYQAPDWLLQSGTLGFSVSIGQCEHRKSWAQYTIQDHLPAAWLGRSMTLIVEPDYARAFEVKATITGIRNSDSGSATLTLGDIGIDEEIFQAMKQSTNVSVDVGGPEDIAAVAGRGGLFDGAELAWAEREAERLCHSPADYLAEQARLNQKLQKIAQSECDAVLGGHDGAQISGSAFVYGTKIREAFRARDLEAFDKVAGEARPDFAEGARFEDVFSNEQRQAVLTGQPPCVPNARDQRFRFGVDYTLTPNHEFVVVSDPYSVLREENEHDVLSVDVEDRWWFNGQELGSSCFTVEWWSSDNYEYFHDEFAPMAYWSEFRKNIGRYLGREIPVQALKSPWSQKAGAAGNTSLAASLQDCIGTEHAGRDYEVVRRLDTGHCESLAPQLSNSCLDVRLLLVNDCTGGSIGCREIRSIYAVIDGDGSEADFVVPLLNYVTKDEAKRFLAAP